MKRIITLLVAVVVCSASDCDGPPPPFGFRTLTVTIEGQGTVTRAEGEGTVEVEVELFGEGAQVTLTATPAAGWSFQQWEGDATGPDSPVTVTMDADKNITAVFIAVAPDDTDGDGVLNSDDVCPGFDDNLDDDGDAVPDGCDTCPGGDDAVDTDGDGVADFCDPCPNDNPDDTDGDGVCDSDEMEPLSFFEEEVAGKWYRYHAYDDSGRYLILRPDRTGCKWERPSSGGRIKEKTIYYWELDEDNPVGNNIFEIMYRTSSNGILYRSLYEYHYTLHEIWAGGYSNLRMYPSTTSRDCE